MNSLFFFFTLVTEVQSSLLTISSHHIQTADTQRGTQECTELTAVWCDFLCQIMQYIIGDVAPHKRLYLLFCFHPYTHSPKK